MLLLEIFFCRSRCVTVARDEPMLLLAHLFALWTAFCVHKHSYLIDDLRHLETHKKFFLFLVSLAPQTEPNICDFASRLAGRLPKCESESSQRAIIHRRRDHHSYQCLKRCKLMFLMKVPAFSRFHFASHAENASRKIVLLLLAD